LLRLYKSNSIPQMRPVWSLCHISKKAILFASLVPDRRPPTSVSNMNP